MARDRARKKSRRTFAEFLEHRDAVENELRECAVGLWSLLDDIDTLSDSMKPEQTPYYRAAQKLVRRRGEFGSSDGYTVSIGKRKEVGRGA